MINKDDDFGFSTVDDEVIDDTNKILAENYQKALAKAESKLDNITTLIVKFLDKLAVDPKKAALKWPNRSEVVQKLKNDILTIRNG